MAALLRDQDDFLVPGLAGSPATDPEGVGDGAAGASALIARTGVADVASLRAAVSRVGFTLDLVDDGMGGVAYLVSRWNRSRALPSAAAVMAFVDQLGGGTR
jgi:hypothetical protein